MAKRGPKCILCDRGAANCGRMCCACLSWIAETDENRVDPSNAVDGQELNYVHTISESYHGDTFRDDI